MRERGIETLRGLAAILVVMAHVIGMPGTGLDVADDSGWRWLFRLTANYRMPLFAVISGYVYGLRPVHRGEVGAFLKGKARRLVLPLIFVSTLQYLVNWAVPGAHHTLRLADIWKIYFFTYDQFWFLQAMVLVFLTVPVLESSGLWRTFPGWAACLGVAFLACVLMPRIIVPFSFDGYLYLLVGFLLGVGLHRHRAWLATGRARVATGALFLLAVAVQQVNDFAHLALPLERDDVLGVLFGLVGCVFCFSIRGRGFGPLASLGRYAFGIYLFHRFGQAGARIVLRALGIEIVPILFVTGMLCGIGVPLLMQAVFSRLRITRLLLLGER